MYAHLPVPTWTDVSGILQVVFSQRTIVSRLRHKFFSYKMTTFQLHFSQYVIHLKDKTTDEIKWNTWSYHINVDFDTFVHENIYAAYLNLRWNLVWRIGMNGTDCTSFHIHVQYPSTTVQKIYWTFVPQPFLWDKLTRLYISTLDCPSLNS